MKKSALVMAVTMAVLGLSACGGSDTAATTAAATTAAAADTTAAAADTTAAAAETTAAAAADSDKVWQIVTDTAFKPFEYTDDSGKLVGIDVDILAAIADDQGFKYEIKSIGWDASIAACQAGQADGMIAGASITDEGVQEYAEANSYTTAKHILLKTIDDSGKAIADDEKAAKKQKADKIAAQLKAVTDPQQRAELFDELMAEYNEDTGENSYPHGYCFTSGSMVTEFEDACKELEPYEVSGVVESKYGYHIILRMPTQGDDLVMSSDGTSQTLRQLVAQQQLGSLVTGWVGEADVQWQPKFRTIDYAAVLTPKESFWRRLDIFDWFDQ